MDSWKQRRKPVGVDDMVLVPKLSNEAICENLKKRHAEDQIYTYISDVLISVNPFKRIPIFDKEHVEMYQGKFRHELPPHIFALAETAYRNMVNNRESQCVIISGESGAGKTEASKLIMQYIAAVSGNSEGVERIKKIILESNPLLEAFGNAKTVRNNNSSRFGKYFEIQFDERGDPVGGKITNYLLEKSRVVYQTPGERNFHIFYQLIAGATPQEKEEFATEAPEHFHYLNQSGCFEVDHMNDKAEFQATRNAMNVIGITKEEQYEIFKLLAGILWLGNITFIPDGDRAQVEDMNTLNYAAYLLGVDGEALKHALMNRIVQTGTFRRGSTITVPQNAANCAHIRDALAKALYDRLFDWIVAKINKAMMNESKKERVCISVLDIYGFEIFDKNAFEQFCINYVNEKLQQIFIELTLKQEQDEYKAEGIKWVPIDFFNNKIVCDLIEGIKPPGIFALLDDTCSTTHSMSAEAADEKFMQKVSDNCRNHRHFLPRGRNQFIIKHYAGDVIYNIEGFTEKNTDSLYTTLIDCMQTSNSKFIVQFFPEDTSANTKKKPTTAGFKIKRSSNELVQALMKCTPHYIRCIKSNENKAPREFDDARVLHQVKYLGLLENIRVRRAGWAYRLAFDKFFDRFRLLSKNTWLQWHGDAKSGCKALLEDLGIEPSNWQLGKTKIFLKHPETLFNLEEMKERKFYEAASLIQKAYKSYKLRSYYLELKESAANLLLNKKQRRRLSINRVFIGDYVNYTGNAQLQSVMKQYRSEGGIVFGDLCERPIRKRFRGHRLEKVWVLMTPVAVYFIIREKVKKQFITKLERRATMNEIEGVSMSTRPDNWMIVHIRNDEDYFLDCDKKTEFLTILHDQYKASTGQNLYIRFADELEFKTKKGKKKSVIFKQDPTGKAKVATLVGASSKWTVTIADQLPADTKPKPTGKALMQQRQPVKQQQSYMTTKQTESRFPIVQQPTKFPTSNTSLDEMRKNVTRFNSILQSAPKNQNMQSAFKRAPPPLPKKRETRPKVKALYSYQAQGDDEISLTEGQIIYLIEKDASGWWEGQTEDGKQGLFPGNYVQEL